MSITPRAIQELLEELEASKQSRLRAWEALQMIRATISDLGAVAIGPPKRKTFEDEGALLDKTIARALRSRNTAIKELIATLRELDKAALSADKSLVGPAHQAALKALALAEDLLQA
jgi:hypothetical protein